MDLNPVEGCQVCDILESEGRMGIVTTEFWQVTLAPDQFYLGRAYVTSIRHVGELSDLSEDEWMDLRFVIQSYEEQVKTRLGATHVTWAALMNNAYRDPDPKPHVHWHVRPRYAHPVEIGGIEFSDLEFGEHHKREVTNVVPRELLRQIQTRLLGG